MSWQTVIRASVFEGTSQRLTFQIQDEDGVGFQPDALTLSIYDHDPVTATNTIVNGRDDVDVLSSCDADGNVDLVLEPEDVAIVSLGALQPETTHRRLLFSWRWDTVKTGKHEIRIVVASDFETVAS